MPCIEEPVVPPQEAKSSEREYGSKVDNLIAQLVSAEDTLQMKDDQIAQLRRQISDLHSSSAQLADLSSSNAFLVEQNAILTQQVRRGACGTKLWSCVH